MIPDSLKRLPRVSLANLPTPVHEASRLSASLGGPRILFKRDDLTGLATGGNKTRKLEFLMADARKQGADTVITAGGLQSNHCRQTAAASASLGFECHLVLGGVKPAKPSGNLFLDQLLGAQVHYTETHRRSERMEELASQLRQEGKSPYVVPVGGSTAIGACGYVLAMHELWDQLKELSLNVDHILFATSSGGTQAGLALGAKMVGYKGTLTGISIDQVPDEMSETFKYRKFVAALSNQTARHLQQSIQVEVADININYDFLGKGYGVVGENERHAVPLAAKTEGILVGPVYTGRALGALVTLINQGHFHANETVLFWHTGDESALHAYVGELS